MTWDEFQRELICYKNQWERMKEAFAGPIREFLDKSSIVVSCGRSFSLDSELKVVAELCPAFFLDDPGVGLGSTRVNDAWRVEIKFPYVDIDLIEELKRSPYCDSQKTLMRPSSATVVLRK